MEIYAWENVSKETLEADYTWTSPTTKETYNIYPNYNTDAVVNMPFVGTSDPDSNAQGWLRNDEQYFKELYKNHPEYFSEDNVARITGKKFEVPIVDDLIVENFPDYDEYFGENMIFMRRTGSFAVV